MEPGESSVGSVRPLVTADQAPPTASTLHPASDFAGWVRPHLTVMAALAVREVGQSAAADIVEETLLRAWRRRDTFHADRGTARAWLLAILRDQGRRHRIRHPGHRYDTAAVDRTTGAEPDDRLDLDAAIARLPDRQREVITLYYIADASTADIAALLGISSGTVKSTLHDARDTLRRRLESR